MEVGEDQKLQQVLKELADGYKRLGIAGRSLSYVNNLSYIQQEAGLTRQQLRANGKVPDRIQSGLVSRA